MSADHRLSVHTVTVTYEAIRFEDGTTVAVELAEPRRRHALVHEMAGRVEVLNLFETAGEAHERCRALEEEMARLTEEAAVAAGGRKLH